MSYKTIINQHVRCFFSYSEIWVWKQECTFTLLGVVLVFIFLFIKTVKGMPQNSCFCGKTPVTHNNNAVKVIRKCVTKTSYKRT